MLPRILDYQEHYKKSSLFKDFYFALFAKQYKKALFELDTLKYHYRNEQARSAIALATAYCQYKSGNKDDAYLTLRINNITYLISLTQYRNSRMLLLLEDLTRDPLRLKKIISTLDPDLNCLFSAFENIIFENEKPTVSWFIKSITDETINKYFDHLAKKEVVNNLTLNPKTFYRREYFEFDIDYSKPPKLSLIINNKSKQPNL